MKSKEVNNAGKCRTSMCLFILSHSIISPVDKKIHFTQKLRNGILLLMLIPRESSNKSKIKQDMSTVFLMKIAFNWS